MAIWTTELGKRSCTVTTADREAGAGEKGTSQHKAIDQVLGVCVKLGTVTYDPKKNKIKKDYKGEVGEEAYEITYNFRDKSHGKAVHRLLLSLDNKNTVVNKDADSRSEIDGRSKGSALPEKVVRIPDYS